MVSNVPSQSRRWVYTLNNYDEDDLEGVRRIDARYHVFGREVGAEGTPHLQGAVVFTKPKRLAALKRLVPRAHFEVMRGSVDQASDYCKKEGDFEETGEKPEAGSAGGDANKKRWSEAMDAAKRGDLDDVPDDIRLKYYRTLKEVAKDYMVRPEDCDGVTGVWYYGEPNTGKSRYARLKFPDAYLKMQNKWWDGYQGEDFVIIDDFDSKELAHHLKIWADRYAFLAETKGGAIAIRPKKIVITSNFALEDLFDGQFLEALKRRFKVWKFSAHTFNELAGINTE